VVKSINPSYSPPLPPPLPLPLPLYLSPEARCSSEAPRIATRLRGFRFTQKACSCARIAGSIGISVNNVGSSDYKRLYSVCSRASVSYNDWWLIRIASVSSGVGFFWGSRIGIHISGGNCIPRTWCCWIVFKRSFSALRAATPLTLSSSFALFSARVTAVCAFLASPQQLF
jgi:hypothetical protein